VADGRARPRVTVLSFTDQATDPRVNRQVRFLAPGHDVTAIGTGDPNVPGVRFVGLDLRRKSRARQGLAAARLLTRRFETYYWNRTDASSVLAAAAAAGFDAAGPGAADLVIANDVDALGVAFRLARGGRVLFDAHEYAPLEFEDRLFFRVFERRYREWACRTFIPRVAEMATVCNGIADKYLELAGRRPDVIWNAPDYEDLAPALGREAEETVRMVHHGAAIPSRRIELMIRAVRRLPARFTLDLLLVGPDRAYFGALRAEAGGDPRVRFLPPVPMRDLSRYLNAYDVGLFLLEPTNFNYRHALPNKFFEFAQARLAIAIGPSPEMAALATQHDLGVIADDFTVDGLVRALAPLDRAWIEHHKRAAHAAARELSADTTRKKLLALVARALAAPVGEAPDRGATGGR